jgi:Sugar-transfer associated ATP-grasp
VSGFADRFDNYRQWAALATAQTGKGWLAQIREIRALRRLGGNCGISDYYWYKLYDEAYQEGRGAADFLGWKMQGKFSLALNPRHVVLPAWDKTVFMQLAMSAGLPVAPILACYHPASRISPHLGTHLRNAADVGRMLRDAQVYPLFGKPAYSQQGYGSAFLQSHEPDTDSVVLLNGTKLTVEKFIERIHTSVDKRYHRPACGYVFQKPLVSASEIQALTNWPAICGVRIVCLNGPDGVVPIRAIWKVAVAPNHIDNFSLGKNGNLLANVDLATGEVTKMIGGFWPGTRIHQEHPTSGAPFTGFRLPGWNSLLEACARGGAVFPLMRVHHWDFALTDQGPQILELNDLGSTELAQVHGHGLLTPPTREFLKRHAHADHRDWVSKL